LKSACLDSWHSNVRQLQHEKCEQKHSKLTHLRRVVKGRLEMWWCGGVEGEKKELI